MRLRLVAGNCAPQRRKTARWASWCSVVRPLTNRFAAFPPRMPRRIRGIKNCMAQISRRGISAFLLSSGGWLNRLGAAESVGEILGGTVAHHKIPAAVAMAATADRTFYEG